MATFLLSPVLLDSLEVLLCVYNRVVLLASGSLRLMSSWLIRFARFSVKGGEAVTCF
jgi:hypothetical protein